MGAAVRHVDRSRELVEPVALLRGVEDGIRGVRAEGETVVVAPAEVTADDTVLRVVSSREVVLHGIAGATDADIVVHHRRVVVEHEVLPVGARAILVGGGVARCTAGVDQSLIHHRGILRSVENVALLPFALPAIREVVVDAGLTELTALGGDEHHTVGSTRTVDGARGSILQHLHALNVGGVDHVKAALNRHTVDDIQRVGVVDGSHTTDADAGGGTRLTTCRGHRDTGSQTLQGVVETQRGSLLQVLSIDLGDRRCHDALLLNTVTHDHHLVQALLVFLQRNLQVLTACNFLRRIANVGDDEARACVSLEVEVTVNIGNRTTRCAFLHDGGTNHRLTCDVNNSSRIQRILGHRHYRKQESHEQSHYSCLLHK